MEKMVLPCWMALTRRVQNEPPSRSALDEKNRGLLGIAGPQKVAVQ